MSDDPHELSVVRAPWSLADHAAKPGARFVAPEEFLANLPGTVRNDMVKTVVAEALAHAADADGVLLNFSHPEFYADHVAEVFDQELDDDEESTPLVYDRFVAVALLQCLTSLVLDDGVLAHRGNGDSFDYRLIST